ncbi:hypothetical protein [Absidia glauca]|uniref:protein-tyrosine-phosphatase n=1 Tax=Absidia glauca TaxID=4829 RepID=A0A168S1J2_ABSGL|nr:hypothetical protein [Absidia glauca]
MIPSNTYSTPSLPSHEFPKLRPLSANLSSPPPSSSLAQRRRNNKNLSLCLLPSDTLVAIPPSTPFLSTTTTTTTSSTTSLTTSFLPPSRHYYLHGPIAILPGLYLGDEHNANNDQQLAQLNIHGILNVAAEVHHPTPHQFQTFDALLTSCDASAPTRGYKKRAWHHHIMEDDDTDGSMVQQELHAAVMDVDRLRKAGRNVLVHCQCGLARSATVIVAYVMYTLRLSMSAALHHVKQHAPHINPNLSLMYQLREYELAHPVASSGLATKWKSFKSRSLLRRTAATATTPWWPTSRRK